jgi:hypothetical protein
MGSTPSFAGARISRSSRLDLVVQISGALFSCAKVRAAPQLH